MLPRLWNFLVPEIIYRMFNHNFSAKCGLRASRLIAAGACVLPALANAHPGHYHPPGEIDEFESLSAGFIHPLTGMDHLILALAAGWLAFAWRGGKSSVPALTFLGSLAMGAFAGRGMEAGAGLEVALAVTLIAAGAAFFLGKKIHLGVFSIAASIAGLVHGFAHGAEAAGNADFLTYASGFLAGSALLVAMGGLLQMAASKLSQPLIPRIAGAALVAFGSVSLFQAL